MGSATNMCKVEVFDGFAKIGRRWLSAIANAEASIFIISSFETMQPPPVNEAFEFLTPPLSTLSPQLM